MCMRMLWIGAIIVVVVMVFYAVERDGLCVLSGTGDSARLVSSSFAPLCATCGAYNSLGSNCTVKAFCSY
jgi:hypothetical protein